MTVEHRLKQARELALGSLDALAGRRILVAGDFLLDRYLVGRTTRLSREAPVVIIEHEDDEVNLGGAGNATRNVRALGGKPIQIMIASQAVSPVAMPLLALFVWILLNRKEVSGGRPPSLALNAALGVTVLFSFYMCYVALSGFLGG